MESARKQFLILMLLYKQYQKLERINNRRWGVRPINKDWRRAGYFKKTFLRIKEEDEEQFFIHTRMTKDQFNKLLEMIEPSITAARQRIGAEERLSITLLVLAHASSLQSVAWSYKLGKTTVRNIVLETCEALWSTLSAIYLREPTEEQYVCIAEEFAEKWNMPNCVGAIDGKHIAVKAPNNSGSLFYNYKKYFSIVLMATCDAKYCFTAVSVGSYGSESDGGIFHLSPFGKALYNGTLPLPPQKVLPGESTSTPYYFVADAAFPLRENLMRPFPGQNLCLKRKVFNYRLSRARRTLENAFGILSARWRILLTTLQYMPDNCESIVLACLVLHNLLMQEGSGGRYCPTNYIDRDVNNAVVPGDWRMDVRSSGGPLRRISTQHRHSSAHAVNLRERLADYFIGVNAVPFQPT